MHKVILDLCFLHKNHSFSEVSSLANLEASFKIDYTILYNRLCSSAHDPLSMMMLYTLIQKNTGFKNFILSRVVKILFSQTFQICH
jgi:hypothetical protein